MKIVKQSVYNPIQYQKDPSDYIKTSDNDLASVCLAFQGRVSFGPSIDGYRGQNMSGEFHRVANTGTADTEFSFTHNIGTIPQGDYLVTYINKGGVVYVGSTAWTSTTVYFKCSAANASIRLFILK